MIGDRLREIESACSKNNKFHGGRGIWVQVALLWC